MEVTSEDTDAEAHVNRHNFLSENGSLHTMCYESLSNPHVRESYTELDLLWKFSVVLKVHRRLGSGLMLVVHKGDHPGESSVMFLPIRDLDPNDLTSSLFCSHAKQYKYIYLSSRLINHPG